MTSPNFVDICGTSSGRRLALDQNGGLLFSRGGSWEPYDFNTLHKGYEPSCFFTAIAYASGLIYIAGVDESGLPHIFASLSGEAWERLNLAMLIPGGGSIRASGRIARILHDPSGNQLFLACQNGQLVTLPDCPKCVKVRQAVYGEVTDARIDKEDIVLILADGSEKRVPIDDAAQLRVSLSYVREKLLPNGGLLVDLRPEGAPPFPDSVCAPFESLADWLELQDKSRPLVFVCERGARSGYAARLARKNGFGKAYSLGGIKDPNMADI
jgi:rhodanese-related sulfurtransferase